MTLTYINITHWGWVTHICVGSLKIIGSYNGLLPGRSQAIIWTSAGILLIGRLGANLGDILIQIPRVSFKEIRLKVSSAKWRPFCLGLNVLMNKSHRYGHVWWHIHHSVIIAIVSATTRYTNQWNTFSIRWIIDYPIILSFTWGNTISFQDKQMVNRTGKHSYLRKNG